MPKVTLTEAPVGEIILEAAPEEAAGMGLCGSFHGALRLLFVGEIIQIMEQSDLAVKDAAVDTL